MDLYPAIDVHAGRVVRASRTDLSRATVYHADPVALAEAYASQGARWLHVVDLDRAFGVGDQTPMVAALVKRLPIPVQAGGAPCTTDAVRELHDCGVRRVLLGARAAADPDALGALAARFGGDSLGLAIDVRDRRVWARGWEPGPGCAPLQLAVRARQAGLKVLALTDLSREGSLSGSDWPAAATLARQSGLEVLVSGGVDGLDDLARIREAGLAGAIVGRALLEGRFTLQEALACCSSPSPA